MAVVVAVVTGDLPLAKAVWLVVETEVLVTGELVGGRWPAALVMAARRPSGFVPYCTGWNNLQSRKEDDIILMEEYQYYNISFKFQSRFGDFIADLMGFIGHGLGRGAGSGAEWISSMSC